MGQNNTRAGPPDGRDGFPHRPRLVEHAPPRRGFDHRILAAHLIRAERRAKAVLGAADQIEAGAGRLHHDDVGPFIEIELDLFHRFIPIPHGHLIRLAIAEPRRRARGLAKRPVERRREFRGIRHDGHMGESTGVERFANSAHTTVHHVARCDEIDTGARLHHRDLPEQVDGRIVVYVAVAKHTAMAVIGVFAQADVADHQQLWYRALHGTNRLLRDALLVVSLGAGGVFGRGNAEQNDAAQPQRRRALGLLHEFVDGQLSDTRHRRNGRAEAFTMPDEKRPDELRRDEVRLLHQTPERAGAAQSPHAANRELCAHWRSKLAAPSPSSNRATASPARSGAESSISADAVSCTVPFRSVTRPYKRFPFPVSRASTQAATGAWHPPPSAASSARSADTASALAGSCKGRSASRVDLSSARISMPSAPWPGAGITSSGSIGVPFAPSPSRSRPAMARSAASRPSCRSTLRTRVGTLPRRGTTSRSGRRKRTCATRRRLDVPTRVPAPRSISDLPLTSASRGSWRSGTAPRASPGGSVVGRSLRECTATSMRPSSSASSISLVKKPFPSSSCSGRSTSASPRVLMITISARATPPLAPSRCCTHCACQRASSLPRVPISPRIAGRGIRQDRGRCAALLPSRRAAPARARSRP